MNYAVNKKYFKPRPSAKVALVLVGITVVLWLINIGLGILSALITAGAIYLLYCGKPSDADIDAMAAGMLEDIKNRAFPKLGIDEEEVAMANPIEFWGYEFNNVLGDEANRKASYVCGKDGYWRSSEVVVCGFYFSENIVHYYYRVASLVSDAVKEGTEEYFYKDIVSVKTESVDREYRDPKTNIVDPKRRVRFESFVLRNMGGESTWCNVSKSSDAEQAVAAFRSLLKQKKAV